MIAGIDTMVLIWALPVPHFKGKKSASQDVAEMQRRSRLLLGMLEEGKNNVLVPTITVAEWLTGIDPKKHGSFIASLHESFRIVPFDIPAAAFAAQLWQQARELPKDDKPQRVCMKADVMIVASAKMGGATHFYSHEAKVRRLVELAGMTPHDLPTRGSNLFSELPAENMSKKKPE